MKYLLLFLSFTVLSLHADDQLAGHSAHGEAFNEGPRQKAVRLKGMGKVQFPVTTESPRAQRFFNQGVSQLHGFWNFEAERSFRQVLLIDTNCVMAYWGIALANDNNAERAKKIIAKTKDRQEHLTERERLYIKSVYDFHHPKDKKADDKKKYRQLIRDMEAIVQKFPDDVEACAFLVLQIWKNTRKGLPINSHQAVDALIDQILAKNPNHHAHHYRIHLWDYEKRERAMASAAACGPAAPGIAHMWHMPGHIYSKLNRYVDTAWHQEASARLDHANMIRTRIMPGRIHNYGHNNGWLSESLGFTGRASDALSLAANMIELPRTAKFDKLPDGSSRWKRGSAFNGGQNRLFRDLPAFERWEEVLRLNEDGYFADFGHLETVTRRLRLLGLAHLNLGNDDRAASTLDQLRDHRDTLRLARYKAADDAEQKARDEKKKPEEIDKIVRDTLKRERRNLDKADHHIRELETLTRVFAGEGEKVLKDLQELKEVSKLRHAGYLLEAGDTERALKFAREEAKKFKNKKIHQARVIDILWRADEKDEAKKHFKEALRPGSEFVELDLPVIKRLAPIAKDLGWPADWRLDHKPAADLGFRPELDELGPFRWRPYEAPNFRLRDSANKAVDLKKYRGKPVLVILYLGSGCAHCMKQLNAFAPTGKKFEEAGIPMIAVSTDTVDGLKDTFDELDGEDEPPFTIVSDAKLRTFKAFRAFDDFEDEPLHGTFLLDAHGLVRWQDISYEPFMNPEFVLEEAKRLVRLPAPQLAQNDDDDE